MDQPSTTCLVDNWTLELAGSLLDRGVSGLQGSRQSAFRAALDDSFIAGADRTSAVVDGWSDLEDHFSALANVLSALLLFDRLSFLRNGMECTWQRLGPFAREVGALLHGEDPLPGVAKRTKDLDAGDTAGLGNDVLFYLALSSAIGCDLLLSPRRSAEFRNALHAPHHSISHYADDLLASLDAQLAARLKDLGSALLTAELVPNLEFPSLASLVLSQAGNRADIVPVALKLRRSRGVRQLRELLADCAADVRHGVRYARLVHSLSDAIRYAFDDVGYVDPERPAASVGFSVIFFSVEKDIGRPVAPYLVFLRDVVRCRLEFAGFQHHARRLFGIG